MISITKKEINDSTTYKLELFKDNNVIYNVSVDIDKVGTTVELRDTLAKIQLMKTLLCEGPIETIEELGNLIPVYEENK